MSDQLGLDIGVVGIKPPPHMSASSIGTYNQCPLRFKFQKIDKIPSDPSKEMELGILAHEVIEAIYRLPPHDRTLAQAKSILIAMWGNGWQGRAEALGMRSDTLHRWRWQVWWCIENAFKLEDPKSVRPAGIETRVSGKIRGVPILGFVDRWERNGGTGVVVDYKTGKVPRKQYEWEKIFQMMIYAHLLAITERVKITETRLIYLKEGVIKTYEPTPERKTAMGDHIEKTWADVVVSCETGVWPAQKSKLCDWCDYKGICPEFGGKPHG